MALFIATSEGDRQRFVQNLLRRGWKPDPYGVRFQPLEVKCFRVYDNKKQLRVSYWEPKVSRHGPFAAPEPSRGMVRFCRTPGHEGEKVHARALCRPCYNKWLSGGKVATALSQGAGGVKTRPMGHCPMHPKKIEYRRGVCVSCYRRWRYWTNPKFRAESIAKLRALNTRKRAEKRETEAAVAKAAGRGL